jgi:2-methylcitrate dehydratase PrpD
VDGKAGAWQFTDEKVLNEDVIALRRKIKAEPNNQICKDQAVLKAILKNGNEVEVFIEHALGSLDHPLSDKDLEEKFMNLTEPYLSHDNQKKIIESIWKLDELSSIKEIIMLCQGA